MAEGSFERTTHTAAGPRDAAISATHSIWFDAPETEAIYVDGAEMFTFSAHAHCSRSLWCCGTTSCHVSGSPGSVRSVFTTLQEHRCLLST